MKNSRKCQNLAKIVLKNEKVYAIISLPNIVNKQYCKQKNLYRQKYYKFIEKKGRKKERMPVQTITPCNKEKFETIIMPQYVDFESAARYLASLFFKHNLKDTDSAIHCTVPKIEKLLAIVAIVQYKKGVNIFYEDILIKKCGVGFDCLDWPSEIIDMRKEEDYFNTGETNLPITNNIIVNSVAVPKLYFYTQTEQLPADVCDLIDLVFFRFANYKASFLGAMFDEFKMEICNKQNEVYYVDPQNVTTYFCEVDTTLNGNNQVYDFIFNT